VGSWSESPLDIASFASGVEVEMPVIVKILDAIEEEWCASGKSVNYVIIIILFMSPSSIPPCIMYSLAHCILDISVRCPSYVV
jgi:hypothetical protein